MELSEVASVFNGKTPNKDEQKIVGHPVLKIKDVTEEGEFTGHFGSFVDEEMAQKYQSKFVRAGDTLILNAAHNSDYVGSKVYYAASSVTGSLATGEWLVVRTHEDKADPRFINYWIQSKATKRKLRDVVKGIHLYPKDVADLSISLPSIEKQRETAATLQKADHVRRARRYAQVLSDAFLQSVFLDMFGDPMTNAASYEVVKFSDIVASTKLGLVRGASEMNDSHPYAYVRMDAITGDGTLNVQNVKRVQATEKEVFGYCLKPGDFLFNTRNSRELVGKTALFMGPGCYLFNNNIMQVRFLKNVAPEYMTGLFQTQWAQRNLETIKSGTTSVFAIYYKDLRELPVLIPPFPEQEKYARVVRRVERLRTQQREATRQAEHLFQTLLHRAFQGEV